MYIIIQSVLQHKKLTKDFALEHFDDFYGSIFGNKWKSIRVALLCENKYVALVNNFGDSEKIISLLESKGNKITNVQINQLLPQKF